MPLGGNKSVLGQSGRGGFSFSYKYQKITASNVFCSIDWKFYQYNNFLTACLINSHQMISKESDVHSDKFCNYYHELCSYTLAEIWNLALCEMQR
jgi:hypothetical protein